MDLIRFKTDRQQHEWSRLDIRLRMIACMIAGYVIEKYGLFMIVTDCLRLKEEDDVLGGVGIHPLGRALDFNLCQEDGTRVYDPEITEGILEIINRHIPYGKKPYNTIKFHDVAGEHFHLQVNAFKHTKIEV